MSADYSGVVDYWWAFESEVDIRFGCHLESKSFAAEKIQNIDSVANRFVDLVVEG